MTGFDLQQLIVTKLVQSRGGTRQRWRRAVGELRIYSVATHPHCNWEVRASGSAGDVEAVEEMADRLRADYAIVTAN